MEQFFQVVKELSANHNHQTAVGIDGVLVGEKAVLQDQTIVYATEHFPEGVKKLLENGVAPGLLETGYGRIFVESLGTMKKLVLCGGGHVSAATLSIAKMLDFHITVIEDRPDFAQSAKAAGADTVVCDNFNNALQQLKTDKDTYVVIMTRGHRHDLDCLHQMLQKEYAYLGMMGSKGRVRKIKERLTQEGFDAEKIQNLHAPIGLSISAVTPAEIAVSVMAEMIQEKNQKKRQEGYEREVAEWLFSQVDVQEGTRKLEKSRSLEQPDEPLRKPTGKCAKGQRSMAVLATIIARKGSAPRQAGTKMLIFADGGSIGTIGGGCMEAEVKSQARHMLSLYQEALAADVESIVYAESDRGADSLSHRYKTCFVDMTGRDAEEEGMVCGGTLEIFLEIL